MSTISVKSEKTTAQQVHPVDRMPPPGQLVALGVQHVLAMYAGAIAVPLILAGALKLPADQVVFLINANLFVSGIATLIQTLGLYKLPVGIKLPIMQGTTFASLTPMIIIGQTHGLLAIYGAVIVAGIFTVLVSPYFSRFLHFFPPLVTGTIVAVIGLSLLPVAVGWAGGGDATAKDFGDPRYVGLALLTLVLILLMSRFFTGFIARASVLLGLVLGTLVAIPMGLTDFSGIAKAGWIGIDTPFQYGLPVFDLASIAAMIVVMLVVMTETTGDFIAIGEIVERPVTTKTLADGLRADGLSTALGGILNSFPFTAFAQNVGLVALTGVKSRFVVAASGVILIVLGLFPKIAALAASIPLPVLGGAGIALFGMVAASGIKTLSRVNFAGNNNALIVGISVGLGLIATAAPDFYHLFPAAAQIILNSGITAASISVIVLNVLFNGVEKSTAAEPPGTPVPPLPEKISLAQVNRLSKNEFVEKFGRLFQSGDWIAEEAWQKHPFSSLYDLRHAFQEALFGASPERQLALIRSYPGLGRMLKAEPPSPSTAPSPEASEDVLGPESLRDQSSAGLDRLSPAEYEAFSKLTTAYRAKFGFPLVVCVRENTKETILASGKERLENAPAQEKATALVEIAKIANLRLQDLVEAPVVEAATS
jgi:uric acid transporter